MLPRRRPLRVFSISLAYLLLFDAVALSALQSASGQGSPPPAPRSASLKAPQAATTDLFVSADDPTCAGNAPCFSTIQAAVDEAGPGQSVRILPGQYEEKFSVEDKNDHTGASEADRIFIGRAPSAPDGSVVVGPAGDGCWNGWSIEIERSSFVTVHGLVVRNAGRRGVKIRGQRRANRSIHFVQNVIYADGNPRCSGGITVSHFNYDTVIANNVVFGTRRDGIHIGDRGDGPQYIVSNTIVNNGHTGIYVAHAHEAWVLNNLVLSNGDGRSRRRYGIRQGRIGPRSEKLHVQGNLVCGNARGEYFRVDFGPGDHGNFSPTGAEGAAVDALPGCDDAGQVFDDLAGADGTVNTGDDRFLLAQGSPALDAGVPLVATLPLTDAPLVRADLSRADVRPADGDGNGIADYDIGAIEEGSPNSTPTPTATPTPTGSPSPSSTPVATQTPIPTPSPTPTPTPTPKPNPPVLDEIADETTVVGTPVSVDANATDPDLPDDTLTYSLPLAPAGMTIDATSGLISWTAGAAQAGTHDVAAQVKDRTGLIDFQNFSITVRAPNAPPVASEDAYATRFGETLTVGPAGVLENDTDPDDDPLTAMLVAPPTQGDLTFRSDGSFDYTPNTFGTKVHENINLTLLAVPQLVVSSTYSNSNPENGVDGDDGTEWFADTGDRCDPGEPIEECAFFEQIFLRPVAVREIHYKKQSATSRAFTTGFFEIYDADDNLLFTTSDHGPDLDLFPSPAPDPTVTVDVEALAGGPVQNASRVVFRATGYNGTARHGFVELHVIGDGHIEVLQANEEWGWTADSIGPGLPTSRGNVLAAPTVGDLDGDGLPEIIFTSWYFYRLYVVNGEDGSIAWSAEDVDNDSGPTIGDLDGDGFMEIVISGRTSDELHVFEHDGTLKATLDTSADPDLGEFAVYRSFNLIEKSYALADFDADGIPEIIVPDSRADGGGRVAAYHLVNDQFELFALSDPFGCGNNSYRGVCIPTVADVDLDGQPEIVAGSTIYGLPVTERTPPGHASTFTTRMFTTERRNVDFLDSNDRNWGWNGVGNFDDDAFPEIAMVGVDPHSSPGVVEGTVTLFEHDLTVKWGPVALPDGGAGGPPTIADFDSDGEAEIGVASSSRYYVFDTDGSILWEREVIDASSNRTGSTVFDFQNDGSAEVVYRDERNLWVFRGVDGKVLFRTVMGSATTVEHPVVADVDGDGEAEIVSAAQNDRTDYSVTPPQTRVGGLYVFGSSNEQWVPARPIWNQHTYHVTNIDVDGTVPAQELPNWLLPGMNHFRQNDFLPGQIEGADFFTYKARDAALDSNVARVVIDVQPENGAPEIISTPDRSATIGFPYLYGVRATDPDFDPLVFSLVQGPSGMTIDAASGLLRWEPTAGDVGDHSVSVKVTDDDGDAGLQGFVLTVGEPVRVPDVRGLDETSAAAALDVETLDVGRVTERTDPTIAAGLVLDQSPPADAIVELESAVDLVLSSGPAPGDRDDDGDGFTPNEGDCDDGNGAIRPDATDDAEDGTDQNCDGFDGDRTIAEIVVENDATVLLGARPSFTATAVFDDGTSQIATTIVAWESLSPAVATLDASGIATTLAAGSTTVRATLDGVSGTATLDVVDVVPGDDAAPTAEITTPTAGDTVLGPIDVVGTATDANFLSYELAFAPVGEAEYTVLAEGAAPVVGGILGRFDPTLLLNDLYEIRLTAFDRGGNRSVATTAIQVDGDQKVGLFTLEFTDAVVPVAGLPITVLRRYDSRDKRQGDFGIGWTLGLRTLQLRTNRVHGTGWFVQKSSFNFSLVPEDEHKVSLTLPDGQVEVFDLKVSPSGSTILPFRGGRASYVPRSRTQGTLEVLDNPNLLVLDAQPGVVELLDDLTFLAFDPKRFRYTDTEGHRYVIDAEAGLESITDRNGNVLTFGPGGITHSSGVGLAFSRDGDGRITTITDPEGRTHLYEYNPSGDLKSYTDSDGNQTQYRYNRFHGLLDIIDARGIRGVRNEYDTDGRLIAVTDADGRRTEFAHDVDARRQVVTNRLGHVTVTEYDERGNVTAQVDALGDRTEYTYDAQGNELTRTDPLGRATTKTFDDRDNLLTIVDVDGEATARSFGAADDLLTSTNPVGGLQAKVYDSRGNRVEETDPDGRVIRRTFSARGELLALIDAAGATTTYEYDASGYLVAMIDATGVRHEYTNDPSGRRTSDRFVRTLPDGSTETIETRVEYDGRGQVTRLVDALGHETLTTYDGGGRVLSLTDRRGNVTRNEYDANGRLTRTIFADGSEEVRGYDAEGRQTSATDRDGNTTTYEYDARGRNTRTVYADGTSTQKTYDAVGRILTETDQRGNVTIRAYAANQETVTDALGNVTVHVFDGMDRRIQTADALGRVFRFEYDGPGNLTRTIWPDGTTTSNGYDPTGRHQTARTDQAGRTTNYAYDPLGRLLAITDPLGGVTRYHYDEAGLRVAQTDVAGHTTRMEYDAAGRLIRRIRPLGESKVTTYDANGNLASRTDADGTTVTYAYDSDGRLTGKTFPDATTIVYEHTPAGLRTRAGGATYTYDTRGRMTSETKASGEALTYGYDAAGNRTSMTTSAGTTTYGYDALNRLQTVTDAGGTTTYTYDAVGNRVSEVRPNGLTITWTYDNLNRLIAQTTTDGGGAILTSYAYTLGAAGNRVRLAESGTATSARVVDYEYDDLLRLVGETIDAPGGSDDRTVEYAYDGVGNRLQKIERLALETITIDYSYDANDRLLQETRLLTVASLRGRTEPLLAFMGFGLSPFFGLVLTVPAAFRGRRRGRGRKATRRAVLRGVVAVIVITATALAPGIAHAIVLDALFASPAAAQPPPTVLTYAYDDAGNTIGKTDGVSMNTYDYDDEHRLVAADIELGAQPGTVSYTYDADGIRESRTKSGTTTEFVADKNRAFAQVVLEQTGADVTSYTLGSERISQTRSETGTHYYQRDGHGSTRQLTDAAGAVTDTYTYDAFGVLLDTTGTTPNEFLYAGEQLDPNIGSYYLRARYYAQDSGRFLTTDPFEGSAFDPVSLHRYLYAHADPVNNVDPSGLVKVGLTEVLIVAAISLAIGSVVFLGLMAAGYHHNDAAVGGLIAAAVVFSAIFIWEALAARAAAIEASKLKAAAELAAAEKAAADAAAAASIGTGGVLGNGHGGTMSILMKLVPLIFGIGSGMKAGGLTPSSSPAEIEAAGDAALSNYPRLEALIVEGGPGTRTALTASLSAMTALSALAPDPQSQSAAEVGTIYFAARLEGLG